MTGGEERAVNIKQLPLYTAGGVTVSCYISLSIELGLSFILHYLWVKVSLLPNWIGVGVGVGEWINGMDPKSTETFYTSHFQQKI